MRNINACNSINVSSGKGKEKLIMKKTGNEVIKGLVVLVGVLLIIHRRVIAAAITGSEMPEMPEWHKKCFKSCGLDECK